MSNKQAIPEDPPEGADAPALDEQVPEAPLELFPVTLFREGDELPEAPIAYLVGRNGFAVKTETIAFRAVVPISHIPALAPIEATATWRLPPIPAECAMQILKFFQEVWKRHKSEAILLISYHERRGTFRLDAPSQRVSAGHISYEMPPRTEGFLWVGTVHSHGSMQAFHSGTDTHDEEKFDGIHMTFGHVDRPLVQIVASLAVGGQRFTQPIESILGGVVHEKREVPIPAPVVRPVHSTFPTKGTRDPWPPPIMGPPSPPLPSMEPTPPRHVPARRSSLFWDLVDFMRQKPPREDPPPPPPPPPPARAKKYARFDEQHPHPPRAVVVPLSPSIRVETGYAIHVPDDVLLEDQEPLPQWFEQVTAASARQYLPPVPQGHFASQPYVDRPFQGWPPPIGFQHPAGPPIFKRGEDLFRPDEEERTRSPFSSRSSTLDKIEESALREDRTEGADVLSTHNTPWTVLADKKEDE